MVFFTLLPQPFYHLRILPRLEELVEDALQSGRVLERPKRFILMTEYYLLQNGLRSTQQNRYLFFDLGTLMVDLYHLTLFVLRLQNLFDRLKFGSFVR